MTIRKISHEQIKANKPSVPEVQTKPRHDFYILCDNIRSLHNVGAIFRTADGCFAKKIFLCGMTGFPPRKEIAKTALGACEVVPWEYHKNAADVVRDLKSNGVQIAALELTHDSQKYTGVTYQFPVCLVVGNEIEGVSDEVLKECDLAIDLPMYGRANSLNVATACGIAVYEILRQYEGAN